MVDALLIIGALNWGLLAAAQVDLVAKLLGGMTVASRVVYGLVGLAGLVKLIGCLCIKECPACKKQQ
ncbi:MAG: DUF378 domain-containing protein [Candidatus Omnitrophica bacterium]|nr:DUF378 domain-containing protein [Candidatus Omnitrophota bacterium]